MGEPDEAPLPPFTVSTDSKGLSVICKPFKMNTCESFLEVLILKGLRGQKNRQNTAKHGKTRQNAAFVYPFILKDLAE